MSSLARRASAAYQRHATVAGDDPFWNDPAWRAQAVACARALADVLGVPLGRVQHAPDAKRREGRWPWVAMIVADGNDLHGSRRR